MVCRLAWAMLSLLALSLLLSGCSQQAGTPQAGSAPSPVAAIPNRPMSTDEEHAHKAGAHGGIIVSIGKDNYHAEAIFEKGGKLRLYTLARDEATLLEVEAQPVTAFVKFADDTEATSFVMRPEPQAGDKPGMTSQFLGHMPIEYVGKQVEVTIPTLKIGSERFRVGFKNSVEEHGSGGMPAKVAADAEKQLYLTPGGAYTQADIQANGNQTASQKFKGVKAQHDLKPKPGDKLCPVTLTKANAKFTWVVAGKAYEFCCPPCVDEFVAEAKKDPMAIKPPDEFIKK